MRQATRNFLKRVFSLAGAYWLLSVSMSLFFVFLVLFMVPSCIENYVGRLPDSRPPVKGNR